MRLRRCRASAQLSAWCTVTAQGTSGPGIRTEEGPEGDLSCFLCTKRIMVTQTSQGGHETQKMQGKCSAQCLVYSDCSGDKWSRY
jgi:hypothetical protein